MHAVNLRPLPVRARVGTGRIGRGIVAQETILHDRVRDIDPETRDPAVEPEAQDRVEGLAHLLVPPVQVRLLGKEIVQVVLPGRAVERPGGAAEDAAPVVGRATVGGRIPPDVPVPVPGGVPPQRVEEPRMLLARVVGNEVEEDPDVSAGRLGDQPV
jgi:hypothetical protein